MTRNEALTNYILVREWLKITKAVVKRKLYTLKELYDYFQTEVDYNHSISIRSFTIAVGKSTKSINKFSKVTIATRMFRYGIFPQNDSEYLQSHIRRSQRNRKGKIAPHPLGKIILSPTDTAASHSDSTTEDASHSDQSDHTICEDEIQQNIESGEPDGVTTPESERIAKMVKMDLPMALSFFFGKERAKEIKEKK